MKYLRLLLKKYSPNFLSEGEIEIKNIKQYFVEYANN